MDFLLFFTGMKEKMFLKFFPILATNTAIRQNMYTLFVWYQEISRLIVEIARFLSGGQSSLLPLKSKSKKSVEHRVALKSSFKMQNFLESNL